MMTSAIQYPSTSKGSGSKPDLKSEISFQVQSTRNDRTKPGEMFNFNFGTEASLPKRTERSTERGINDSLDELFFDLGFDDDDVVNKEPTKHNSAAISTTKTLASTGTKLQIKKNDPFRSVIKTNVTIFARTKIPVKYPAKATLKLTDLESPRQKQFEDVELVIDDEVLNNQPKTDSDDTPKVSFVSSDVPIVEFTKKTFENTQQFYDTKTLDFKPKMLQARKPEIVKIDLFMNPSFYDDPRMSIQSFIVNFFLINKLEGYNQAWGKCDKSHFRSWYNEAD